MVVKEGKSKEEKERWNFDVSFNKQGNPGRGWIHKRSSCGDCNQSYEKRISRNFVSRAASNWTKKSDELRCALNFIEKEGRDWRGARVSQSHRLKCGESAASAPRENSSIAEDKGWREEGRGRRRIEGGYRARRRKIKEEERRERETERDPESSVQCFPALFENCMAEPA